MIKGIHHTSRTVSNMDASLAFYHDILGLRVLLDTEMQGEMLEHEVGMTDARLRLVLLDTGDPTALELIEYYSPAGRAKANGTLADAGAHHVALLVDDIHAAFEQLSENGVRFTWPPQEVDAGYFRGHRTAYCYDPDELIVELWQTPPDA
jgi:lactoylglutathione lyase